MHPLCEILVKFQADKENFAITGSSALYLRGLLTRIPGDLDVIARGSAWETFTQQFPAAKVEPYKSLKILISTEYGNIEIFNEWLGDRQKTNQAINQAEWVDRYGLKLPLVQVSEVIQYKRSLGREKDQEDLKELKSILSNCKDRQDVTELMSMLADF